MFTEADQALEEFNYDSFKKIISTLKKSGYISTKKSSSKVQLTITEEGKRRLSTFLPEYRKDRTWDGHIYLISYDISENHHRLRNNLRVYLKRLGCALIQESLWISPYYIRGILNEFVTQYHLEGTILISKLGKDGAIGEESFEKFLLKAYRLDDLNNRYNEFIHKIKNNYLTRFQISREYFKILKDDPQLPFSLLPRDWQGDKAFQLFKEKVPF